MMSNRRLSMRWDSTLRRFIVDGTGGRRAGYQKIRSADPAVAVPGIVRTARTMPIEFGPPGKREKRVGRRYPLPRQSVHR